jgi:tRNA pseudouridine32 synthase/23S rRNA pseudouridine746 synthase
MTNFSISKYFTHFISDISHYNLPKRFTFPFCYQPHPLAMIATEELQKKLNAFHPLDAEKQGRMYGVLVVENNKGELGYLAAISGGDNETISNDKFTINFVPPIHQAYSNSEFELKKQAEINQINKSIEQLSTNPKIDSLTKSLVNATQTFEQVIKAQQQQMRENKKVRKEKRIWLKTAALSEKEQKSISIDLSRASVADKKNNTSIEAKT